MKKTFGNRGIIICYGSAVITREGTPALSSTMKKARQPPRVATRKNKKAPRKALVCVWLGGEGG
ncbi:MAG TPA: hypothetical protein PKN34_11480, partial [Azospira sp.]|nr:hypothetical protein [Azospira sp.]